MSVIDVVWPKWRQIINDKFVVLTKCRDRFLILYGSRGSSKSDYAAKQLVYNCLSHKYFKCILYRKTFNSIQESSYANIKSTIETLGLESLFQFRTSPLAIICVNGNKFIARGGDKPSSLKSIKDPTCVWYEEDVPDENDFATISLTIRSGKAEYLQEIFTINPQVEGNPEDNWFWKRFFEGHDQLSYKTVTTVEVEERKIDYTVNVHHSTYHDNRWLPDGNKAQIEDYKTTNPYLYQVYAKGLWTAKQTGGNFYKMFDRTRNSIENPVYHKDQALHLTFDFNVNPFVTLNIWHITGKTAIQIDEICLRSPKNDTASACREFARKYMGHAGGIFIYGDPAGMHEDTRSEKGHNDFRLIMKELAAFKPQLRVHKAAPAVVMRGMFINTVFVSNFAGLTFLIGYNCINALNDYSYLKEASDGTKAKVKEKHPETGIPEEKYGHSSDANDYMMIYAFNAEYLSYQKGENTPRAATGKPVSKNNSW